MNSTSIIESLWNFDDHPEVVIGAFSLILLLFSLLLLLTIIVICCIKRRRKHSYRVSYQGPVTTSSHNFDGGTIRMTRHFDNSFNTSDRFHTLPRHSIVRLPNSDTLIEYEEEGPEAYL